MSRATDRTDRWLKKQVDHWINVIFPAVAVTLWETEGWRKTRILRRMQTTEAAIREAGEYGQELSILGLFERETGIEMTLDDKSWHGIRYLDGDAWIKFLAARKKPMTETEYIYTRKRQADWLPVTLLCAFCLALHRDEGWGAVRLQRFISDVDALRHECGNNEEMIASILERTTSIPAESLTVGANRIGR